MGKSNRQKSSLVKHSHSKHQHQGRASKQGGGGNTPGQKASAFRVSSHKALKAKHKTKQVTSNLKWMKSKSSKEQVNKNNATFSSVQQSISTGLSKQTQNQVNKKASSKKPDSREQVDMEAAVLQMASL